MVDEIGLQEYWPNDNDHPLGFQRLETLKLLGSSISEIWPEPPLHGQLHVFVSLPDVGSPIINVGGECFTPLFALARDI